MARERQDTCEKPDRSITTGNHEDTSNRGTILTRRLLLGGVLGLGSVGASGYVYRPSVIQASTQNKVQEFTLNRESYVVIGKLGNLPGDFLVYSDQNPKTLHLMSPLTRYGWTRPMNIGRGKTRNGEGTVLSPGKYYISSLHATPAVRASPVSFLRKDTGPVITLSEYLIAMRRELLLPVTELSSRDKIETVGINKDSLVPAPQRTVLKREDLNTLFERTRAYEKRVKPPISLAGGEIQEQYQSIVQQTTRARAAIYMYHLLGNNFNLDNGLSQLASVFSVLPNIPSEVSNNLEAVRIGFCCSSAILNEGDSGYVPVGICVQVSPDNVDWIDIYTRYHSQTVPIPVTRESKDPPKWKTPISDIKNELIQKFNELT